MTKIASMADLKLIATVSHRKGDGKVRNLTDARIYAGRTGRLVATLTLGGSYTAEQAVKEFRRDPKRWQKGPLWDMGQLALSLPLAS